MTIEEFNYLDETMKAEVLSIMGIFLSERNEGCFRITLYQVENFYVEIYYHMTRFFYVCIRSFQDVRELAPYLEHIDISEIYDVLYE
jgi:hypothetical protein